MLWVGLIQLVTGMNRTKQQTLPNTRGKSPAWRPSDLEIDFLPAFLSSVQSLSRSVAQSCPTLCDPMNCSTPGLPAEKATAPHSSTLAWKIPWTVERGGLQYMGSLRVGHDWATSLSLFTFMHWRRKWQPTPVFLSGESQEQGSLVGCSPWGR